MRHAISPGAAFSAMVGFPEISARPMAIAARNDRAML